jgi:hypothetical protein
MYCNLIVLRNLLAEIQSAVMDSLGHEAGKSAGTQGKSQTFARGGNIMMMSPMAIGRFVVPTGSD